VASTQTDLASSAALLRHVQELAEKTDRIHPSSQCRVVMYSLKVQLEDYMDEIKEWLVRGQRPAVLPGAAVGGLHPFAKFLKHKFREKTILERVAYYEDKIGISLHIVGRFVKCISRESSTGTGNEAALSPSTAPARRVQRV